MSSKKLIVFPEEKESVSRDTEVTIGSILASYDERGRQFSSEGINYKPITLLTTISNLYLIKKYNTNCFMYGDKGKNENFMYGGIVLKFLPGQLDLPIDQIIAHILAQLNGDNLFQIQNFLNCIKNGNPVIIMPLLLQFSDSDYHANMLIYRRELNTMEHFEPHGSYLDLKKDYGDKINVLLQLLVDKINEINNTQGSQFYKVVPDDIRLMPSNEVCIRNIGLQAIQSQLASFMIEGQGYCQMWSLLFAELVLLNPNMNSRLILDEIYKLLERRDGVIFLSNVIRGYVSVLGDEISLYLSEYINNVFTIENISYTCQIYLDYGRYLSDIIVFIVYIEVNVDLLLSAMPKTIEQLNIVEASLQGKLTNYFRLQNELKELLINRKQNYLRQSKESVNYEIAAKLREELSEYIKNRRDIKNYVQNKIFKNYLRNKERIAPVVGKKTKVTQVTKKVGKILPAEAVVEEAPKRGKKKIEVVEEILPAPDDVLEKPISTSERKRTRNKGGQKTKKRKYKKNIKSKKGKKSKKYKRTSNKHSKF